MGWYVGFVLEEADLPAYLGRGSHGVARYDLHRDASSLTTIHRCGNILAYRVTDGRYALPFSVKSEAQRAHGFLLVG